jgi:hyperosmotically inducible periplasmic protein
MGGLTLTFVKRALGTAATCLLVAGPAFASQPQDGWITTKVKFRLIRHPGIPPLLVHVNTDDGVVWMSGDVTTEDDRRLAGNQAMKVAGVKDVHNEIRVVPPKPAGKA